MFETDHERAALRRRERVADQPALHNWVSVWGRSFDQVGRISMALLKADVDELHKLAGTLAGAAMNITKVDAAAAAAGIGAALAGSGLDGVCTQAAQFVDGAYQRVAGKLTQVSGKIETTSQWYLETDDSFAAEMRKFDVHHAGGH
ncbi:hypothetical protein J2W56_003581 [Nocardia kruczakiae]|uniref:Excreted virulence factor EspC (Type VII ESX diderm) n=1 Tax=Nocardia kruczakiae TaxID=261477 RepID=A0ABU1XH16_9NOCA|nr:hypothetical protein [Nocardia kruczakiae]MDR7169837.1 hypothetical protein [Nocardia kruczakiae]